MARLAQTTTLHVTLHQDGASGPIIAAGILRLNIFDLFALLGTLHASGCERRTQRWRGVWHFARFFARELWRTYVFEGPAPSPCVDRAPNHDPVKETRASACSTTWW